MLRRDLVKCATDILGDVDPYPFCHGSGFPTPAIQAQSSIQFVREQVDLVFELRDTFTWRGRGRIAQLPRVIELRAQRCDVGFNVSSRSGVEGFVTVAVDSRLNAQACQLLRIDSRSRSLLRRIGQRPKIEDVKFAARVLEEVRELPQALRVSQTNQTISVGNGPIVALAEEAVPAAWTVLVSPSFCHADETCAYTSSKAT
jgi:hypothetical protein